MHSKLYWSNFVALTLFTASAAFSQKAPQLGYAFPPAICAGAATNVQLGGFDFTPDMQWFVHRDGVRVAASGILSDYQLTPPPYWHGPRAGVAALPIAREVAARIEVDSNLPAGLIRWQVANANGASQTAMLYVSRGHEITENRSRDLPQRLPALPVAVSGRLSRLTEVDRYEMVADVDGLISVDLMARRLGANFQGMLRVRDSGGKVLAELADTQGTDGGLTFPTTSGETYVIELHDADFRGDRSFVYRLALNRGPRVLCTLPSAGQRGTTREVEFIGLGVVSGKPLMESIRQTVTFPSDSQLAAHTLSLTTLFGVVDVSMPLSDVEEQVRVAPQLIAAPRAITNVLPPATDRECFSWSVEKDEFWSIDLQSRAIGGPLDVALTVLNPDGKPIAELDDLPGSTDVGLEFHADASGVYSLVARSMATRSGAVDDIYRLQLRRSVPDFALSLPQQQINVPLGGKAEVTVQATRYGGFAGDIRLIANGLPPGISAPVDWKIAAGQNECKAAFTVAPDADVDARVIQVCGLATMNGAEISQTASALAPANCFSFQSAERRIEQVLLAVTMPPPFDILLIDRTRQREVNRGSTCLAEMDVVRKDGFTGEIKLEMAAEQARYLCGSRGLDVNVPADVTRVIYPSWMSECLGTEFTIRMATHGVAAVPDPKGNLRYLTKSADAPITMIMEGGLLKLTARVDDSTIKIGDFFDVPIVISRSAHLQEAAIITLEVPKEAAGLLQAEPLTVAPGKDDGVLRIRSVEDERLTGSWSLKLRASAMKDAKWPVISDTEISVFFKRR